MIDRSTGPTANAALLYPFDYDVGGWSRKAFRGTARLVGWDEVQNEAGEVGLAARFDVIYQEECRLGFVEWLQRRWRTWWS